MPAKAAERFEKRTWLVRSSSMACGMREWRDTAKMLVWEEEKPGRSREGREQMDGFGRESERAGGQRRGGRRRQRVNARESLSPAACDGEGDLGTGRKRTLVNCLMACDQRQTEEGDDGQREEKEGEREMIRTSS